MNFKNFTVFDFETTGLQGNVDQVIEASVIRVRDGLPSFVFNTFVALREGVTLSPKITEVTGIELADLDGAISEEQFAYTMDALIDEDELLIAHNALFDLSFLTHLFYRYRLSDTTDLPNPFIDTLTIARSREPYPHKLGDVCKRNGIELANAHSAEADTMALMDVVLKYHRDKDISEWLNVAGYRPKYGEPDWVPAHATLKKQGSEVVKINDPKPRISIAPKRQKVSPGKAPASPPHTPQKPAVVIPKVVTTTNKRTKLVPDNPEEFEKLMPSGLIDKKVKERIDHYIKHYDEYSRFEYNATTHDGEFDGIMAYLEMKGVSKECIDSDSDVPDGGEACIYVSLNYLDKNSKSLPVCRVVNRLSATRRPSDDPFANDGRLIDISDDDLPF